MNVKIETLIIFLSLFIIVKTGGVAVTTIPTATPSSNLDPSSQSSSSKQSEVITSSQSSSSNESKDIPSSSSSNKNIVIPSSQSLKNLGSNSSGEEDMSQEELYCAQTQPTKGISEDCTEDNKLSNENKKCCYVEIKYEQSTKYSCIVIDKGGESEAKKKNTNYKSIVCHSKYIKKYFILEALLLFFFI